MVLEILNWILLAFLAVCNAAWIRLMDFAEQTGRSVLQVLPELPV